MSLTIRILKIVAIISLLMMPGLSENGMPYFAFLLYCLWVFIMGILGNSDPIFWEGLLVLPILATLIVFLISKSYKILLFCFLTLLITQIPSLITYYKRIDYIFLSVFLIFVICSTGVIILIKKRQT